jgi:ribosomal protein L40E
MSHCGHENLLRAMYCFQCGKALDTPDTEDDDSTVARRSQRIVQTMWPPENLPEASRDNLPGTAMLRSLHLEEPLTCLSCGALNRPNARFCTSCGIPMVVPDRESHLVARASARTDVGQVRENNEDSIGLWAMQGLFSGAGGGRHGWGCGR